MWVRFAESSTGKTTTKAPVPFVVVLVRYEALVRRLQSSSISIWSPPLR